MKERLFHPFGLGDFKASVAADAWGELGVFEFMPVAAGGNRRGLKRASDTHRKSMDQREGKAKALSFSCPQREKIACTK